ncbi:acid protease [Thozetella sp. PMI_491]|nr:acid protease [Thozetella sp. PMI_491]
MKSRQVLALASLFASTLAAVDGVVSMNIRSLHPSQRFRPLRRRGDTHEEAIANNISYGAYFTTVTVGGQSQQLLLDTGSSDTWVLESSLCTGRSSDCVSSYNPDSSSSFSNLSLSFDITYLDGSSAKGYYFEDTLKFSSDGASVSSLQMGLATSGSDVSTGIMGIGFEGNEAAKTEYENVIDKMFTSGVIGSRAYSLYLDDLDDSSGTILFGGLDSDKFTGSLISVPIQKTGTEYTAFYVALSSVASVYSNNGSIDANYSSDWTSSDYVNVILDSGTTLTYLPETIADSIFDAFGVTYNDNLGYASCECSLANSDLAIEYQFGGSDGPKIQVTAHELVIDTSSSSSSAINSDSSSAISSDSTTSGSTTRGAPRFRGAHQKRQGPGGGPSGFPGGGPGGGSGGGSGSSGSCYFGISKSSSTYLLGDTFLRSAYVVYDLDSKQIALAQSNLNATSSSVIAMTSGSSIPGVSSTATASSSNRNSQSGSSRSVSAPQWEAIAVSAVVSMSLFVGGFGYGIFARSF